MPVTYRLDCSVAIAAACILASLPACSSHTLRSIDAAVDNSSGGVPSTGGVAGAGGVPGTGGTPGEDARATGGATGADALSGDDLSRPGCLINGMARAEGEVNAANPCEMCAVAVSPTTWSPRDGVPCDDGVYCDGADTCRGGACEVHVGNPCPDAVGNLCASACDEVTRRCLGTGRVNDCGTAACGLSPSSCFSCGTCDVGQACARGRCGCTPQLGHALAASPPPIPNGLKSICLADPNQMSMSAECPTITCGSLTFWALSLMDNSDAMTLVGYDASKTVQLQVPLVGARYIYEIAIDANAQTVTLIGQANAQIVVPWVYLWP